jgi:hypothetical protein
MIRIRAATEDEREALGRAPVVCECGVALRVHPPLPRPLPWGHGRPCDRPVDVAGVRVFTRYG